MDIERTTAWKAQALNNGFKHFDCLRQAERGTDQWGVDATDPWIRGNTGMPIKQLQGYAKYKGKERVPAIRGR